MDIAVLQKEMPVKSSKKGSVSLLLAALVISVVISVVLPVPRVHGHIIDLTVKELFLYSDHIFTGLITGVETQKAVNKINEDYVNTHYQMNVTIQKVYKTVVNPHIPKEGDTSGTLPPYDHDDERCYDGQKVYVMSWMRTKYPSDFKGPLGVRLMPKAGETMSFFTRYLHRDPTRRSMYQETFPHVDEDSEEAAQEDFEKWKKGVHAFTRKTTHKKAYNVLIPNGLSTEGFLVSSPYVQSMGGDDL